MDVTTTTTTFYAGRLGAADGRSQILPSPSACSSSLAFMLLADRKIWAACRCARPQRRRPVRPAAVLRRPLKFVLKEPIIPSGADKAVFLLAPLITFTLALGPGR
jgi:NADH:ubiquinone oxidoreductase subunit H